MTLKRSFRHTDRPSDVHDEVDFYLEMRAREFMQQGMGPAEARRAAGQAFGHGAQVEREFRALRAARGREHKRRDLWRGIMMDVTYAFRTLRGNAGFAVAALATLALGIGATIAVFTVVNGVLLRPLPYKDPQR